MKKLFGTVDYVLEPASWGLAGMVLVLMFAGPSLIGAKEEGAAAKAAAAAAAKKQQAEGASPEFPSADASPAGTASEAGAAPAETAAPEAPAAVDGKAVFVSAGCGSCHTFKAAGSTGVSGPDLDAAAPDAATAEAKVRGGGGIMPAFEGQLSDAEIAAVAQFVSGG